MPPLLQDRVALITGASRGLGAEIARRFAAEGAFVFVNYFQSPEQAEAVVEAIRRQGGGAQALQGDVTQWEDVQRMIDTIAAERGQLDIIVNNALPRYQFDPSAAYTRLETLEWAHFEQQIAGAVRGTFHTSKAALPMLKQQGRGHILNISSNLVYNPVVTYYDYTTAKAGLLGLTRNLAAELGPYGIRVNLLAGGLLQTTDASQATSDDIFQAIAAQTPLREATRVEDFARAAVFFACELSGAVTGQSLAIDGGLTMP